MRTPEITRRSFLSAASAVAMGFWSSATRAQLLAVSTTAHCAQGTLTGRLSNGVKSFRGVPFAQPPVGALRFKPPAKPLPYSGIFDATSFSAAAVQPGADHIKQSEDCLTLNIWAPDGVVNAPVFVWIHGGGFTGGYAFDPLFDGRKFASDGIVCVTIAYRLGVLGFLDVEPLLGPEYAGSANNGLLDLIAALEWVHDNIAAFGGDPGQVTVGGESAGAKLSDILMGTPLAVPFFQQIISESGGAERVAEKTDAQLVSNGFADVWQSTTSQDVKAILAAPAKTLVDVGDKFAQSWPLHFPLRPEVDGSVLRVKPIQAVAEGASKHKRLLIGTNRDESAAFIGAHPTEVTAADLGNMALEPFQTILQNYADIYPELSPSNQMIRAVTAEEYWIPSTRLAETQAAHPGEVYMYRFDFTERIGGLAGLAFHGLELGFVWESTLSLFNPVRSRLSTQIHSAWSAFILGGAPDADRLPNWPTYSLNNRETMVLDSSSTVQNDPQAAERNLWKAKLL